MTWLSGGVRRATGEITTLITMSGDQPRRVRWRLLAARDEQRMVKIHRAIKGADVLEGFVLEVGARWNSFASFDWNLMGVNGFVAVRTAQIQRVDRADRGRIGRRTLELHGEWPPARPPAPLALDRTGALLQSVAAQSPLIVIGYENQYPDECMIGAMLATKNKKLTLRLVSPRARWIGDGQWPFRELTWIEFGGNYEAALAELAGPLPAES